MRAFDHIGIPTAEKQASEMYVEFSKVWVTDPLQHPQHLEFLRFEPDSPIHGPLREQPHIAFRVEKLEDEMAGGEVLLGPFDPTDTLRVVFVQKDGAIYEYMQSTGPGHWFRAGGASTE